MSALPVESVNTHAKTAHRLGPVDAIPVGEARTFAVTGIQVAVFRLRDGTLRATQAQCPHAGGPLADGQIDLMKVVCPLHARAFAFADGRCAEGDQIRIYPARDEAGEIVVEL
ncbi:MAG: Rieske (2Fe-2S) protein [Pseudonocardia sp.]|nr:Rieske (2Fe-2S) protein [Pseudonocardia sp.]